MILQARANALESLEFYNSKVSSGVEFNQSSLRSRLGSWFLEHQAHLKRTKNKKEDMIEIENIKNKLFFYDKDLTHKEILDIITFLNDVCDQIRITRIDLKKVYDRTDIEEDNLNNDLS